MSLSFRNFGSSSNGAGIRVTLTDGKRFEDFLNTSLNWYYAEEVVIGSSFNSDTIKAPQLGRLTIYKRNQDKEYQWPKYHLQNQVHLEMYEHIPM
jgi:hypothetical protein